MYQSGHRGRTPRPQVAESLEATRLPCPWPHERWSWAKSCRLSGGALEQIQFLLGHASAQTTERYLGGKQELQVAVNDKLGVGLP
jgi:integrase